MLIRSPAVTPNARLWLMAVILGLVASLSASTALAAKQIRELGNKQVIGATATVEEVKSDLLFKARVDTGATTSSLQR